MITRIGIIGNGNVGSALARGLARAGYSVRTADREPGSAREVARFADTIILAVPFGAREAALRSLGDVRGKTIVDVTNALGENMGFAADPTKDSGAEEIQRLASGASVVKAFNTVFAQHMDKGHVLGERLTAFAASDDAAAKERVLRLARDLGFDAVDAGPLANARWLETLGYLNIQLGYGLGMGANQGFRLVHENARPLAVVAERGSS